MNLLPTFARRSAPTSLNRMMRMDSALDPWLREAFPTLGLSEEIGWSPSVDFAETNGEYTLTAELPGVKQEDVAVDVEEGALTIKGEKREEREKEAKTRRVYERWYGSFERSFALPRSVDPDRVKADFANGVLTVHLPKRKDAMGRKIEIQAGE